MKINYYHDGETTIGVASYDDDDTGIDLWLYLYIYDQCDAKEKRQLANDTKFTAHAKPRGGDEYDKKTGERIVRDKLLVKHAERMALKYSIIDKYMLKFQKDLKKRCMKNVQRMDDAYERLEQYQ